MSCNHCTVKFNFFHKEMGCGNCGLSFCSKCLKQKHKVPGKGDQHVCRVCFTRLSTCGAAQSTTIIPPDAYIRRLESLENPSAPPITMYKPTGSNLRAGLAPIDQQLVDRLENLKDRNQKPPPTELELRKRLASLKGENEYVEGPSKLMTCQQPQTADDLLTQFMDEENIELRHDPQEEIETRLAYLREKGVRPNEGPYLSNLHDTSSDEEIDKITKRIMDEVELEERCSSKTSKTNTSSHESLEEMEDQDALLCIMCMNYADWQCEECDGDLYCTKCKEDVHKLLEDNSHHPVPFTRKPHGFK